MDCVVCGEALAEPWYLVDDTEARYPLCLNCDESDLRLVLLEAEAQLGIDQMEV